MQDLVAWIPGRPCNLPCLLLDGNEVGRFGVLDLVVRFVQTIGRVDENQVLETVLKYL